MSTEEFEEEPTPPVEPTPGFEGFVRANPISAILGALVIGVLLGRFGIL